MTYRSILTRPAFGLPRDLDRMLDDVITPAVPRAWQPAVDVRETADALLVEADLPGLTPADIEVRAEQQVLTISGTRARTETIPGQRRVSLTERAFGTFRRGFQLPQGVDAEAIEASFSHGVLTVRIPKSKTAQPRVIEVKPAATA